MQYRILLAACSTISTLAIGTAAAQTPRPASLTAETAADVRLDKAALSENYVIGVGDVVAISVWKDADLSRTMPVRPDGRISLPVIGEVQAAGLTAVELQERIVAKLDPYVRHPQVNVMIQEIRSRTFNVMGKVTKPGSFELIKPTTVLDAIALAGGFQEYARVTHIYVLRPGPGGSPATLPFNYKAVIKGKNTAENVSVQPGDTVVVP